MFCPSCGAQVQAAVKFCPSCGAAQTQSQVAAAADAGAMGQFQAQLGALPVVGTVQQRLNALPVPGIPVGASGAAAASADLVWSAGLALAALLTIWFMRWFMIPVFLAVGALAIVYGVRPGVSVITRSTLFVAAGTAGIFALALTGGFDGIAVLGAMILMVVAGRGVWGLLKEGRPGGDGFRIQGKRFTVLIVGLAVCLVSLLFQWEPVRTYNSVNWVRVGTIYKDSSGNVTHDGTWLSPRVKTSFYGGDNGNQAFLWLLGAAVLLLVFRNKPWPKWVHVALTVCLTFMLIVGIQALGSMLGLGIILFFGGFSAIAWSLLTRRA